MKNEVKHTAHSSYRCEYHVVFAPKYRRKVIYKTLRKDVIEIIKKLCKEMFEGLIPVAIGECETVRKKPAPDSVWIALEQLKSWVEEKNAALRAQAEKVTGKKK